MPTKKKRTFDFFKTSISKFWNLLMVLNFLHYWKDWFLNKYLVFEVLIHWQGFFLKSGKMDLLDLFLDVSAISCFRGYYRSRLAASFTRLRPLSIFSDEAIFLASVRLRNYTEAHILQQSPFKTSCYSLLVV